MKQNEPCERCGKLTTEELIGIWDRRQERVLGLCEACAKRAGWGRREEDGPDKRDIQSAVEVAAYCRMRAAHAWTETERDLWRARAERSERKIPKAERAKHFVF